MEQINLLQLLGIAFIIGGGLIYMFKGTEGLIWALLCSLVGVGVNLYSIGFIDAIMGSEKPFTRYISQDEKRAAKMFKQNCKQVGFTQGNKTKNTGVGLTTNGSAVFGTMSGSNEDTYNYICDGNIQYTLTYDIENYRKYYK